MRFIIFFIFFLIFNCISNRYAIDTYFSNLTFRTLNNHSFTLRDIKNPVFLINFYSPTCAPCVKELPALHLLYNELQKYHFELFLVVEPDLEKNLPEVPERYKHQAFDDNSMNYLIEVLNTEVKKRNIQIPILIVNPPFKIDSDQIITGTPETLIFTTSPLRLHYNFIGPISTSDNLEEIKKDTRFLFLLQILNQFYNQKNNHT